MTEQLPVLVSPPSAAGGRRVRMDGQVLGRAHNVGDLVELLRRAGMDDADAFIVETAMFIDWRGGGPEVWSRPQGNGPAPPD
ncbi:hypothetical protein ACIBKX_40435 [Streptomyces sp. NPDC050658]|uniref:hypothetical protein n=1 Tax=unclassified Streptomyces TaxID=2593676 RepID=UPI003432672F